MTKKCTVLANLTKNRSQKVLHLLLLVVTSIRNSHLYIFGYIKLHFIVDFANGWIDTVSVKIIHTPKCIALLKTKVIRLFFAFHFSIIFAFI